MLRTITSSSLTAGADSTSDEACTFHNWLPLAASKASTWPLVPPTATTLPFEPTPAVRSVPALMRHCDLPVAASRRSTLPSLSATNTLLSARAGENTYRPALPAECFHTMRAGIGDLMSTSFAGGFFSFSLNGFREPRVPQPAVMASRLTPITFPVIRISFYLLLLGWGLRPARFEGAGGR